jgi:RNase P/RNase MRP subunit p30
MAIDITLFRNPGSLFFALIHSKTDIKDFDCDGFLIDADEKECRRTIEFIRSKNKSMRIGVVGKDDEFNRRALETLKINYLISPELTWQKDSLKQRASGMNHVTAKIAKDKKIQIIIAISVINKTQDKKQRAILISRIIQNIKICRKAKCDIKIASFANSNDELIDEKQAASIGFSLGMSSEQTKNCLKY